jgi:hypothetical protein
VKQLYHAHLVKNMTFVQLKPEKMLLSRASDGTNIPFE